MRTAARFLLALCLLVSALNALALCSKPEYLGTTLLSPQSAQMNWSYYYGTPIAFQVQYRLDNLTSWTSQIVSGTANTATLTNLLDHRDYVWRVRTICSEGDTSAFTPLQPFNTACATPSGLVAWSVQHESAQLSWSGSLAGYQVQYRAVGQAAWVTAMVQTSGIGLTNLTNNTDYEWRVRGICAPGDTSAFTLPGTFRTVCPSPQTPTTANVTFQSARFSWYTPGYSSLSEVHWRAAGRGTWTVVQTNGNYWEANGLINNTTYEWKVRQVCSATAQSAFTPTQVFITQCLPPTVTYTSIVGATAAELKWQKTNPLDLIDLRWRAAGTPNWSLAEGLDEIDYILTNLPTGTVYEWQVRSVCSAIEKSAYSDPVIFQTRCSLPTGLATTSVRHNAVTLSWAAGNAELQVRAAGTSGWQTHSAVTAPYTLTGLTTNTTYEWRVRSVCGPGVTSDFTATQLATTRCQPPTLGYSNEVTVPAALTVRWSGADWVDLQLRPAGTSGWASYTGLAGTSYTFTNLTPGTSYEVRAQQRCGPNDVSDYATNTYGVYCGGSPYISVAQLSGSSATVSWSSGYGQPSGTGLDTLRHDLRWQVSGASNWSLVTGITSGTCVLTNLATNVNYNVQVRRECGTAGYTNYESRGFSIPCPTLYSTSVQSVSTTSAQLNWYVYSTYSPYTLQYRSAGSAIWTTITGIVSSVYTLTGLTNNTTYEWQIKPECETNYTAGPAFGTQCGGQLAYLDVTNLTYNSARLTWRASPGPTTFDVQYRPVGSSTWTTRQAPADEVGLNANTEAYCQLTLFNLTPGQAYEWQLRALCSAGVQSTVVAGATFTPNCAAPPGVGSYVPYNGSLTVSWTNAPGALHSELQWRAVGSADWNTEAHLTQTGYSINGLSPGTTYEYRLRHSCAAGVYSAFSSTGSRLLTCSAPYTISGIRQSPTTANLTWTYYSGNPAPATIPQIVQYRPQGSTNWLTIPATNATSTVLQSGYVTYAFALTTLAANTAYEWRVRADCGAASADFTFPGTIEASCPIPASFYSSVQNSTSVWLSWSVNNGNASALVQWRASGTATWATVSVTATSSGGSYALTGLQPNSSYEWRIATRCGTDSLFTPVQLVQTNCAFALGSISGVQAGSDQANVSWHQPYNFKGTYLLQYRPLATAAWTNVNVPATPASLTGLTNNTHYQVRVRAVCDVNASGPWTNPAEFRTSCPTLSGIGLSGGSVTPYSARILWWFNYPIANVEGTILRWRLQGATVWREAADLVGTSFELAGLTPNTAYEYQVVVPCSQGAATVSTIGVFRTARLFASNPDVVLEAVTPQAVRVRVSAPGSATYVLQWRLAGAGAWQSTQPQSSAVYVLTGLTANAAYETRAMIGGPAYSPTRSFTTVCEAPINLRTSYSTATEAGLTWTANADSPVQLQWRLAGDATWSVLTNISSNTYVLGGLSPNTTYEWRAVSGCSVGAAAIPALPVSFVTNCAPPTISGTSRITTTSARLVWLNAAPTLQYTVRYRLADAGQPWTIITNIAGGLYDLDNLTTDKLYEWGVGVECGGAATQFAGSARFRTGCQYGNNLSSRVIGGRSVLVTWSGSGVPHEVRISADGINSWTTVTTSAIESYTLTGLASGPYYYWQIRPVCAAEDAFVGGYMSIVLNCAASTLPTNLITRNIRSTSAQLAWTTQLNTPQPDAQRFTVRWRAVGATNWNVLENVSNNHTLTALTVNTNYEWQVRSECSTTYQGLALFRTACQSPTQQRVQQTGTSAQLTWNDTGENVPYVLQWRDVNSPTWNTISDINTVSYGLSGLSNGTTYEWQVRSQCSNTYESVSTFKVQDNRIQSIAAGPWNVPGTWSCSCIPAATDTVLLRHAVTVPGGYNGAVKTLFYEGAGQLRFGTGAGVRAAE